MKKSAFTLFVTLMATCIFCSCNFSDSTNTGAGKGVKATRPKGIVGVWQLIEFADLDSVSNKWVDRYGKHPKGYFIYTAGGVLSINVSHENPLKLTEEEEKNYNVNIKDYYKNKSFGYFGTYTYEPDKGSVIHHVKGGNIPSYIDTDQPRQIALRGDTAIIGDNIKTRRVLVRVE